MSELSERITEALAPLGPDAQQFYVAIMTAIEGEQ